MNETEQQHAPSERQRKYLGRLLATAHKCGVPYLPTEQLTRAQVSEWIDYLRMVVDAEERVREILERARRKAAEQSSPPYLLTSPRDELPSTYRSPYEELPRADDHEHLVGSVRREDGIEESVCVLCGASA